MVAMAYHVTCPLELWLGHFEPATSS